MRLHTFQGRGGTGTAGRQASGHWRQAPAAGGRGTSGLSLGMSCLWHSTWATEIQLGCRLAACVRSERPRQAPTRPTRRGSRTAMRMARSKCQDQFKPLTIEFGSEVREFFGCGPCPYTLGPRPPHLVSCRLQSPPLSLSGLSLVGTLGKGARWVAVSDDASQHVFASVPVCSCRPPTCRLPAGQCQGARAPGQPLVPGQEQCRPGAMRGGPPAPASWHW